jgi:hypothetical protein
MPQNYLLAIERHCQECLEDLEQLSEIARQNMLSRLLFFG